MTLNEAAERIAYERKDPFNIMFKETIKFSIRYWRAILIRRDVAANGISEEYLQRIHLPLIKVDKADSCNFDLGACNGILRTKFSIPQPIRLKNDIPFKYVGDAYGKSYSYTEYEEIPFTCYNRFTSKSIRYNYTNGYLYVFNNKLIKSITIQTAFVDPYKANTVCGGVCFNDDSEFPCPADLMFSIITGILNGEFKMITQLNGDVDLDEDETIK